jgi:serine/threonine protein kinase
MDFKPGDIFHEVYRIERELGSGGMAKVYLAEHLQLGIDVALKTPRLEQIADSLVRARFEREARLLASLNHENIVTLRDARWNWAKNFAFIALEHVDGVPLNDRLLSLPAEATLRDALALAHQLARALDYLHSRGIVHRDAKKGNVLVERASGRVKLLDFGLARSAQKNRGAEEFQTNLGIISGTPGYMAPEQLLGRSGATPASDIYSFGVIVYRILTRSFPWPSKGRELMAAQLADAPAPVRQLNPRLPKALDVLFRDCLDLEPDKRPPSAGYFFVSILRALGPRLLSEPYATATDTAKTATSSAEFQASAAAAGAATEPTFVDDLALKAEMDRIPR